MNGPRIIRKRITPPQAHGVASQFRSAADQVNSQIRNLERVAAELDATWEGNSKNRFFEEYAPTPGQLRSVVETLRRLADEIEHITVEIEIVEH